MRTEDFTIHRVYEPDMNCMVAALKKVLSIPEKEKDQVRGEVNVKNTNS